MIADLVIRGGSIVDGSGDPAFVADVAISGGRIAAVSPDLPAGAHEIDARGLLVTPGWIDIHTHYDGQVTWESHVTPSSCHGTTTVVMGNCGVGFAPVRQADRARLIELMEGVEDIPGAALHAGLDWSWESFSDYLAAIERRPHDIDIAAQLPHGALRVYVMGERGARREAATRDEMMQMRRLTCEAIQKGALGFSTTRTLVHRTATGDLTPTMGAADAELMAIAHGLRDAGAGVIQWVSDFDDIEQEFRLLERLVEVSGRPLSFSLVESDQKPEHWRRLFDRLQDSAAKGFAIKGQVQGRPVGLMLGLQGSVHPYVGRPSYDAIAMKPLAERVETMRDPKFKARLLAESSAPNTFFATAVDGAPHKMFELGSPPNYEPSRGDFIAARASRLGRSSDDLTYELLLADDGRNFLFFTLLNYSAFDLENALTLMESPHTLLGLSDGGAHVGAICDVSVPTYMLTHWTRDRQRGRRLDLAAVVKWQSRDTAIAVGLYDRGLIRVGYKADLNVIDYEKLQLSAPYMAYDLPDGARRLMQDAVGYVATIVSGEVVMRDGVATELMPGRLVRGPQMAD